jgi:putative DNA primase/helicase
VQLTYLTPDGSKSLVEPVRRRFDFEAAPHAVFEVKAATGTDTRADVVVAEGLEDGLSVAQVPGAWRVVGLPGGGVLAKFKAKKGEKVLVVADGDEPLSGGAKALEEGVDHLLLDCRAETRLAIAPLGKDANDLLREHTSLTGLIMLLGGAKSARLSLAGQCERLSRMPPLEAAAEVYKVADELKKGSGDEDGVRISVIDLKAEIKRRRRARHPAPTVEEETAAGIIFAAADEPLDDPVPPLVTILDTIKAQLTRFIVLRETQIAAITLWLAAAHLMRLPALAVEVFPKLAIQSKDPASGKTTLLKLVWNVLPSAKMWTYPSGAFLVRAIEQKYPSLCLDELQYAEDKNLLRVINAAHERALAYVPLLVPDPQGGWTPREFHVWTPMALARLGEFSTPQQSRSLVIWMLPKMRDERAERLRRVEVPELVLCRRQLAAWAATVAEWLEPEVPENLLNRDVQNWEPLINVANMAGGDWPRAVIEAVEEAMDIERIPTVTVRLLSSIWQIFQPDPDQPPAIEFITSKELRAALIADPEEDWATINHGTAISFEYMRERLSHLVRSQNEYYHEQGERRHRRGYSFAQFKPVFARHVGRHPLSEEKGPPPPTSSPGPPGSDTSDATSVTGAALEPGGPGEKAGEGPPFSSSADDVGEQGTPSPVENPQGLPHANGEDQASPGTDPIAPNGKARSSRRRSSVEQAILETVALHPEWSAKQIGKAVGRAESVVKRILAAPKSKGDSA